LVGEPAAAHAFQFVERLVPGFDDDGGERELGEALHLEGERSVGERGGEVSRLLRSTAASTAPSAWWIV
jgi:hypothetical protein